MWLFITPHALKRFRERVALLSDEEIFELVQQEASKGRWIMEQPQREPILQGYCQDQPFYMVIGNGEQRSLSVISILSMKSPVHYKLCRGRSKKIFLPAQEIEEHLRSCIAQYLR